MKRVFGRVEVVFDITYLLAALVMGLLMLAGDSHLLDLAGLSAVVLAVGDAFHLVPRIAVIMTANEERYRKAMGMGKLVTSVTMTLFYLLLWQIAVELLPHTATLTPIVWLLAAVRILLCMPRQNGWLERYPPVQWGIYRNLPFVIMGVVTAVVFLQAPAPIWQLSPAILLSFAFYLPVVLWANSHPRLGMLMLPKTCAYLWMLAVMLSL